MQIEIRDLLDTFSKLDGQTVKVCGWVRTTRASKSFGFIELNDGTSFSNIQIVFEDDIIDNFK